MRTLTRALIVSVLATATDYAAFHLTVLLGGDPALCAALGCVAGGCVGFTLGHQWAFRGDAGPALAAMRYLAASGATAIVVAAGMALLSASAVFDVRLRWLLVRAVVYLAVTHPLLRGWVFTATSVPKCSS
jgi:putative flippase GtrA